MSVFLWLKSRRKIIFGVILFGALVSAVMFMPDVWETRMRSIENYEEDGSAQGRINTWTMAYNLANARPIVGGGFEMYTRRTFQEYAPNPEDVHSAHSIYFQMLGEHGYVGLLLFLALGLHGLAHRPQGDRPQPGRAREAWAGNLARSIQVSLIGFAVGGAFVNISYWELQYYELVLLVAAYRLVAATTGAGGQVSVNTANAHGAVPS